MPKEIKDFNIKYDFFGIPSSNCDLLMGKIIIKIIHQLMNKKNKNFISKKYE